MHWKLDAFAVTYNYKELIFMTLLIHSYVVVLVYNCMAIVNKPTKTSATYVYESHSYRDKEAKQPRSKRKPIGRMKLQATLSPRVNKSNL